VAAGAEEGPVGGDKAAIGAVAREAGRDTARAAGAGAVGIGRDSRETEGEAMSTFASEYEALRMQEEMHTLDGRFQKVKNRALALQAFIEKNTLEGQGKSDSPFC